MDLTQHEGGYLSPGIYWAKIVKIDKAEAHSGTTGLNVTFEYRNKEARGCFWQYDKDGKPSKAVWRLAELAVSCGLAEEERKDFKQAMLLGRHCGIEVAPQQRNPSYNEVINTFPEEKYVALTREQIPADEDPAPAEEPEQGQEAEPATASGGANPEEGTDRDIPF